jgi:hypothetical protein
LCRPDRKFAEVYLRTADVEEWTGRAGTRAVAATWTEKSYPSLNLPSISRCPSSTLDQLRRHSCCSELLLLPLVVSERSLRLISRESDSAALAPFHQWLLRFNEGNSPCSVHNWYAQPVRKSVRECPMGGWQVRASVSGLRGQLTALHRVQRTCSWHSDFSSRASPSRARRQAICGSHTLR